MFGAVCFWIFSRFAIFNHFSAETVRITVFLNDFLCAQLTVDLRYSLISRFNRSINIRTPRDLVSELDVKIILMALSESVGARLRENGFQCRTVEISIRDNGLYHFTRQCKLDRASNLTEEIARTAFELFQKNYNWEHPIRSLGVRGCDLVSEEMPYQLDLFMDETKREKIKKMDQVVDEIRGRFGYQSIQRAFMYQDKILAQLNAKEHTVHPQAYFHG